MNPFQTRGDSSIVSAKRKTAAWIKEAAKSSPGGRTETSVSEMSANKSSRLAQREKPGGRRDVLSGCQDLKRPPQSCFWVRTAEDGDGTLCGLVMFLLELSLIIDIFLETSTLKSFYYSSLVCLHTFTSSPSISWTLCLYITDCLHIYAEQQNHCLVSAHRCHKARV